MSITPAALAGTDLSMATTLPRRDVIAVEAPGPTRRIQILIILGAFFATATLIAMALDSPDLEDPAVVGPLACWLTLAYIGAGLVAWRRRPASRFGILMILTGFGIWINFLSWSGNDYLFTLGLTADLLIPVLLLHLFLAFPSGRLEDRLSRVVVVGAYATGLFTALRLLLGEASPRNQLAVTSNEQLANTMLGIQLVLLAVFSLAGVGVLIRRRLQGGRNLRSANGYLVGSFAFGLALIALLLVGALLEAPWTGVVRLAMLGVLGAAPLVFLIALLQARLVRSSVADLVIELGVSPDPVKLREAVSRALRDPSADVAYWLPEFEVFADGDGLAVDLGSESERGIWPVSRDGQPVAVLLHDPDLDDETELLASVGAAAGLAIENARLQVELKARLEEIKGSRARILEAERSERRRLERDLHDGAQQRLVALSLELSQLEVQLAPFPELRERASTALGEVAASLSELRDLAQGLHPAVVTDHGLSVAVESLATRSPIPVTVTDGLDGRLPEPVEVAAFFVVAESLTNVSKHAAASRASVALTRQGAVLVVEVIDDGDGGVVVERGSGLRGLADRVEALGGSVQIWSPIGKGTTVRAEIPCGP